jgi:hypothetical protein
MAPLVGIPPRDAEEAAGTDQLLVPASAEGLALAAN